VRGRRILGDVFRLLSEHHLPRRPERPHWDSSRRERRRHIVGSAALELYADGALLRSVAVAPTLQRHQLGRELTQAAVRLAEERRVPAIYLLTTTAADYFPRFGFERVTRADVPTGVQQSVEFASACPATAIVMRKLLRN